MVKAPRLRAALSKEQSEPSETDDLLEMDFQSAATWRDVKASELGGCWFN